MSCCRSPATSKSTEEFRIPEYIFKPDAIVPKGTRPPPSCPVIVFINSKSGGQLGGALLQTYADLLNSWQVFDLGKEAPDKVLHSLYSNLETRKISGDELAKKIYNNLKLIVAGGDGTAGWLLSVVSDLKLTRPPPIATMPLGTGNNLHFAFGWQWHRRRGFHIYLSGEDMDCLTKIEGNRDSLMSFAKMMKEGKKNPGTDRQSVKVFLDQVKNAKEMKIDSWHIIMRMRDKKEGSCDPIALELPRSLHAFHRVSKEDSSRKANARSTAYHLQTDGQIEVVNRCLQQFLWCFVMEQPNRWFDYLHLAELWYNTCLHSSLGMSPFEATFGRKPPSILQYIPDAGVHPDVQNLVQTHSEILNIIKFNLQKAINRITKMANKKRRDHTFNEGNFVFLRLRKYRQSSLANCSSNKLEKKFFGPFKIIQKLGQVAYKLELPPGSRIHNVFHVSLLKEFVGDPSSIGRPTFTC